ncbi:hypothetical protein [Nocardiopsis sp. NRRL B-16309]|uniref:hypothetical protein n=1 Tax=Nocardiopsis sp. NRRL B-16309 TaxID=1519494 RepID=UPI0006ADC190|nr:hypothetical protein [Nocardiopsis sp. NRRL B-16309]KOX15723.1 hypothetical protein ADL05_14005 [Nocardiopsis sp. NRRL B-16309]
MTDDHGLTGTDHPAEDTPAAGLLARLRGSELADDVLSWHDCYLDRAGDAGAVPLALASGEPLTGLATTAGGESFQLCGGDERRPVFYYDDAESVLVLGRDLAEAVELLIGVPHLIGVSHTLATQGPAAATAKHAEMVAQDIAVDEEENPPGARHLSAYLRSRDETHRRLAAELGVRALPVSALLHRLDETARAVAPDLEVLWVDAGEVNPIPHALEPRA